MIPSYYAQHSHNLPPNVLFTDHLSTKKNKWSPSFVGVSFYIPLSSFLFVYVVSSCPSPSCFLSFPWQQQVVLGFFPSLSHDPCLSLFLSFSIQQGNTQKKSLLDSNPLKVEKGFNVELTLKVVKFPLLIMMKLWNVYYRGQFWGIN